MSPNLPVGSNQTQAGMLSFDLRLSFGESRELSQENIITPSEARIYTRAYLIGASLGISERFSASVTASILDVSFTGEDKRIRGLGATTVFFNGVAFKPKPKRPGLFFGIGDTIPGGGVPQPQIPASSLSASTFDPMFSLSSVLPCVGPFNLFSEGLVRPAIIGVGKFGRTPGSLARAAVGFRLIDKRGSIDAKIESLWRSPDNGPGGLADNTGGRWVYLSHSARILPPTLRGGAIFGEVRLPIAQKLNGEQLAEGAAGFIGFSYSVHTSQKKHEEEEEAEDEHKEERPRPSEEQIAPLDIKVAIDDGHYERPASLVVPQKITIVDYGASWCHACKDLEVDILWLLIEKFPQVSVRKIDIVDWDMPFAARYLSEKTDKLPYVEIYDRQGELIVSTGYDMALIEKTLKELIAKKE
jgi:thiol-disulfide isomerase/thioredoxin